MLDRFRTSFELRLLSRNKVTLNLAKERQIPVHKKPLRLGAAAEDHMHFVRYHALNPCEQI